MSIYELNNREKRRRPSLKQIGSAINVLENLSLAVPEELSNIFQETAHREMIIMEKKMDRITRTLEKYEK